MSIYQQSMIFYIFYTPVLTKITFHWQRICFVLLLKGGMDLVMVCCLLVPRKYIFSIYPVSHCLSWCIRNPILNSKNLCFLYGNLFLSSSPFFQDRLHYCCPRNYFVRKLIGKFTVGIKNDLAPLVQVQESLCICIENF